MMPLFFFSKRLLRSMMCISYVDLRILSRLVLFCPFCLVCVNSLTYCLDGWDNDLV